MSTRSGWASVPLVILGLTTLACGGSPARPAETLDPPAAATPFPDRDELTRLATTAPGRLESKGHEVETWALTGPFPGMIDVVPAPAVAPWAELLAGEATQDMACVAGEIGRFYLQHAAPPSETLRRFVAGWCGSTVTHADVRFLSADVPAETNEAELFKAWRAQAAPMLAAAAGEGRHVGLWFGREGGRAVLAVASGRPEVTLARLDPAPDVGGTVVLHGTVQAPTDRLSVLVNRGTLGVAECELEASVALPAFVARCALEASDTTAWIEVSAFPPHRVLGHAVLRVLARRPAATPSYVLRAEAPSGAADASATSLLALVNQARARAGLPNLVLADAESQLAARLAPIYFAGSADAAAEARADRIALGLMAGWDVDAMITGARVYSALVHASAGSALVAACLDSPSGREVLLDPRATQLAVGGVLEASPPTTAAIFVTYRTLPGATEADAQAGFDFVREARLARGLTAPTRLEGLDERVTKVIARLRSGDLTPEDAESHLLAHAARTTEKEGLRGIVVEADELSALDLPSEVLAPGELAVLAVLTPFRRPGEPWWRWTLIVIAGPP